MSLASEVREFIKNNPGSTARQIADALGATPNKVSVAVAMDRYRKEPTIRHEIVARTLSNVPVYGYFPRAGEPAPAAPAKHVQVRKKKENVPSEQENVPSAAPVFDLNKLADALARQIADQVAYYVRGHLATTLLSMAPTPQEPPAEIPVADMANRLLQVQKDPTVAVKRKPRILIVGLLPMQAGLITQEFGDVFDLRFHEANSNLHQLKDMARSADQVFTFSSKIGHKVSEGIAAVGKSPVNCRGGLTMLKEMLTKLYVE